MDVVDVMTRDVVSVSPATPIRHAARLMVDNRISGLPVVSEDKVVGIISEADFVARDSAVTWVSRVLFRGEQTPLSGIEKVGELMSSDPITIQSTATVREAARVMTRAKVKRLPVVDEGRMVGIVTRSDLVRSYVRSDGEVAADARQLLAVLPAPMPSIQVEVEDGVVILSGSVDSGEEVRLVTGMMKNVEGVAGIDNRLEWGATNNTDESPWSAFTTEGAPR